jgi:hypothetical protein
MPCEDIVEVIYCYFVVNVTCTIMILALFEYIYNFLWDTQQN